MDAYALANWEAFFAAIVAASAALVGLVFVGISINLPEIISLPGLTGRALEPIAGLLLVLLTSTLVLVPGQSDRLLGLEILGVALVTWLVIGSTQLRARDAIMQRPAPERITRIVLAQIATLPFVIAGLSLYFKSGGGLYWLVPGTSFSFVAAMIDSWVLLIEIRR